MKEDILVIAEPKPELKITPAPMHERAALGALTVLGWGSPRHEEG
jgi:hypothetical protein